MIASYDLEGNVVSPPRGQDALEESALSAFVQALDPKYNGALSVQLSEAVVTEREFSGVGFFKNFSTPKTSSPLFDGLTGIAFLDQIHGRFADGSIATFMLGFDEGWLSHLEGQTLENEAWPSDVTGFQVIGSR